MLKIRARKFDGRCSKHRRYNPSADGPGAVKGGCKRCQLLFDIFQHSLKLNALIREFSPSYEERKKARLAQPDPRQMKLL
jgi:hypothetical protein